MHIPTTFSFLITTHCQMPPPTVTMLSHNLSTINATSKYQTPHRTNDLARNTNSVPSTTRSTSRLQQATSTGLPVLGQGATNLQHPGAAVPAVAIPSSGRGAPQAVLMYMGIIDFLQPYVWRFSVGCCLFSLPFSTPLLMFCC